MTTVANTIAYYNMATITALRSLIVQAAGVSFIKLFWSNLLFFKARSFHNNATKMAYVMK